jgi:succinyl-diaminopimelate desuccinylase
MSFTSRLAAEWNAVLWLSEQKRLGLFARSREADIRLPLGVTREQVMAVVHSVLAVYPQATVEELNFNPPSYCPPDGAMVGIIQENVQELRGFKQPIVSLGATDARLWRYRDIPAYVYSPFPYGMGSADEHVDLEEFLHIVRVHLPSAYDYLMRH